MKGGGKEKEKSPAGAFGGLAGDFFEYEEGGA